jgi:uncharacterized protein (DUF1800 family)
MATLVIAGAASVAPHGAAPEVKTSQAVHVLNRITFGARPQDVDRIERLGVAAFIDEQLHPERLPDTDLQRRIERFETLDLTSRDIAAQYEIPAVQARLQRQRQQGDSQAGANAPPAPGQTAVMDPVRRRANLPLAELSEQKILRAVYSDRQLQEVLTDFWFNHFNVDARKGPARFMLTAYERDAIRPHVLGRFRDLLEATARSPAMLFYLDNWMSSDPAGPHTGRRSQSGDRVRANGSADRRVRTPPAPRPRAGSGDATLPEPATVRSPQQRAGLNENYGRELLELHTLGVDGGYTQQDVTEVARAFTGWTIDRPRLGGGFRFAPALHDDGRKVVLGHVIEAGGGEQDGEAVLDILARHPATARFISTKLARRFVQDAPPDSLIDRMTATFQESDGDLRAVMTTLLTSAEFMSPEVERAKVKTPFEFVVSALRATNADIRNARPLARAVQDLGMPLYQCQPPTGYKDVANAWVNTGALVNRMNVALQLASQQMPGTHIAQLPKGHDLVGAGLSDTTRATLARAQTDEQAVALALGSPEFQRR